METTESVENCETQLQLCDPLEGLGDDVSPPQCYRVDCVVFAEPFICENVYKKAETLKGVRSEGITIKLNENVSVRKRSGKGKNVFVHLLDQSNLDCPVQNCTKSFNSPILLRSHIRKIHYSDKQHMCPVCGASFTAQFLLRRHSAVHSDEKKQCPVCLKMLSARTNLAQHLRSHSDTRRHACAACGRRFLRSSTLKVHVNTVHKATLI